ncbi:MAG: ABC-type transport auxiliary lipoprotein family protein [Desulfovibrio sp.]|jgi:cholesterol transport system auxiliary component|nr:ABC-type transport auxiliary lipoprotein family protein [Desulfovibrio sp.]
MKGARLLVALCLCLAGCGTLLAPGPAPTRLQLRPALPGKLAAAPADKQLVAARPSAANEINGDAIAMSLGNREIRYLSGVLWTDDAPSLVQRFVLEALEESNILRGVGDESIGIAADLRLLIDIREFGLRCETAESMPAGVFSARFRLIDERNGKISGTLNVLETAQASDNDAVSLAVACETALSRGLARITQWMARMLGRAL